MTDAEKRLEQAEDDLVESVRELVDHLRSHGATPSLTGLRLGLERSLAEYDQAVLDI